MELKLRTEVDEFYELIGATVVLRVFRTTQEEGTDTLVMDASRTYIGRLEAFVQKEDSFFFKLAGLPLIQLLKAEHHFEIHQRINK